MFNNMTPLEQLTQKIHNHCPELLELSFGCLVERPTTEKERGDFYPDHYRYMVVHHVPASCGQEDCDGSFTKLFDYDFGMGILEIDDINVSDQNDEQYFTILGHPITLEHVLKAIETTKYRYSLAYDATGTGLYIYDFNEPVAELTWEYTRPLHEQSEETIKWLNSVIT